MEQEYPRTTKKMKDMIKARISEQVGAEWAAQICVELRNIGGSGSKSRTEKVSVRAFCSGGCGCLYAECIPGGK